MSIFTSLLTAGANSHQETSETFNALGTDFVTAGIVGAITNTSGVAPATGGYAVNAQGSPNMTVAVTSGIAYAACTPSGQNSQNLRIRNTASANVNISGNASGSTKYDWVYISLDATKAANAAVDASDVATLVTSRSSSNTVDNGTPPTYGYNLAVITVANGASSITNANIADKRAAAVIGSANSSLTASIAAGSSDYVVSGLVWSADSAGSTLNGSMTSGSVYIGGAPNTVAATTAHAFTASKDTYIDVLYGSTGVGTLVYTEVTNNAASPALAASSIRIGIVVTGAGSIAAAASINQGQENRVLPIASSIAYSVTDSLGNLICPRDPNRRVLGYRQITANFTTAATVATNAITGLSAPAIIPAGRKVRVSVYTPSIQVVTFGDYAVMTAWDGTVGSGTSVAKAVAFGAVGNYEQQTIAESPAITPSAAGGLKTYNAGIYNATGARNIRFSADATNPAFILVELL